MRYAVLFVSMMMLVMSAAYAQTEPASPAASPAEAGAAPPAAAPPETPVVEAAPEAGAPPETPVVEYEEPVAEPKGDTVILDDNRRFERVQVLRRTATDVEIEVVKGVAPMSIPRDVVKEILWDDYDPYAAGAAGVAPSPPNDAPPPAESALPEGMMRDAKGNVEILPRVKVPAQLAGKLRKDITAQVRGLDGKDLFEALNVIKQATQLQIAADQPLRDLVSKSGGLKVKVSLSDEAKVNVVEFLENHLLKQQEMKRVGILYKPDRVIVTTKEAAIKLRDQEEKEQEEAGGEAQQSEQAP